MIETDRRITRKCNQKVFQDACDVIIKTLCTRSKMILWGFHCLEYLIVCRLLFKTLSGRQETLKICDIRINFHIFIVFTSISSDSTSIFVAFSFIK